jgi:hypothetical protein
LAVPFNIHNLRVRLYLLRAFTIQIDYLVLITRAHYDQLLVDEVHTGIDFGIHSESLHLIALSPSLNHTCIIESSEGAVPDTEILDAHGIDVRCVLLEIDEGNDFQLRMTQPLDQVLRGHVNESTLVGEVLRARLTVDVILNVGTIPLDVKFFMGYEGTRHFIGLKAQHLHY